MTCVAILSKQVIIIVTNETEFLRRRSRFNKEEIAFFDRQPVQETQFLDDVFIKGHCCTTHRTWAQASFARLGQALAAVITLAFDISQVFSDFDVLITVYIPIVDSPHQTGFSYTIPAKDTKHGLGYRSFQFAFNCLAQ